MARSKRAAKVEGHAADAGLDSRSPRTNAQACAMPRRGVSMTSLSKWFGAALAGLDSGGRRHRSSRPGAAAIWVLDHGRRLRAAADHPERPVFAGRPQRPADHLRQLQLERLLRGRHPHHHVEPALQAGADLLQRGLGQPDHDQRQRRHLLPAPVAGAGRASGLAAAKRAATLVRAWIDASSRRQTMSRYHNGFEISQCKRARKRTLATAMNARPGPRPYADVSFSTPPTPLNRGRAGAR